MDQQNEGEMMDDRELLAQPEPVAWLADDGTVYADYELEGCTTAGLTPLHAAPPAAPADIQERDALKQDAARFRWLMADHDDAATRTRCRELLGRMEVMSYAAACHAIDAAISATATP